MIHTEVRDMYLGRVAAPSGGLETATRFDASHMGGLTQPVLANFT